MGVRACACECVYPHPGASPAVDVSGKCRSSTDNQDSCIFLRKRPDADVIRYRRTIKYFILTPVFGVVAVKTYLFSCVFVFCFLE